MEDRHQYNWDYEESPQHHFREVSLYNTLCLMNYVYIAIVVAVLLYYDLCL